MYLHLYTVLGLLITTAVIFYLLPKQSKFIQVLAIATWLLGCVYIYTQVVEKVENKMLHSTDVII